MIEMVIPNYNRSEELKSILEKLSSFPGQVTVISDGGINNKNICKQFKNVRYKYYKENIGLARHLIRLLRLIDFKSDDSLIVMEDGVQNPDWEIFTKLFKKSKHLAIFGRQLARIPKDPKLSRFEVEEGGKGLFKIHHCCSCPTIIKREIFKDYLKYMKIRLRPKKKPSNFAGTMLHKYLDTLKLSEEKFYWTKYVFYTEVDREVTHG